MNKIIKILVPILIISLQSCITDRSDLKVNIVNRSNHKIFVGELYDCDSCGIMQNVRLYCLHRKNTGFFPQILNANDSIIMNTKFISSQFYGREKIFAINADSLNQYCIKRYSFNITNKNWVKILINNKIDPQKKTCVFLIR